MNIRQIDDCDKTKYLELLLLADEEENMINKYLFRGEMFALYDDDVRAVCVVTEEEPGIFELKNIATKPQYQRMGYGKKLVSFLVDRYRTRGKQMLVGTGDTPAMMAFYHSCGFAYSHTLKNFFADNYPNPIIDDGIRLMDMTYLKRAL